jgi:hypothetical protein
MIVQEDPPYLTHISGFAEADIRANQAGHLSPEQKSTLRRQLLLSFGGLLLGAGIVVWMIVSNGFNVIALFWIGGLALAAYRILNDGIALCNSVVSHVDGDAWVEARSDGESTEYLVHIANLELKTTKEVYKDLMSGGPYRAYYTNLTSRLVAVRVLDGWKPMPAPAMTKKLHWSFRIEVS